MQVVTQEPELCKIVAQYTADPEKVRSHRQTAIDQIKQKGGFGFRPGKAPDAAIKMKFKKQLDKYVTDVMTQEAITDVLFETKIKPLGNPQITDLTLSNDRFTCDMTFLKFPEVTLGEYKGLKIPAPHLEKTVNEIAESFIQDFRMRVSDRLPFTDDQTVEDRDELTIDLVMSHEDVKLDLLSQDAMYYVVGSQYIPNFDENLIGMKLKEEKEFTVNLGENVAEDFRNKEITCKVKLHMGIKLQPHPLDDDLAVKAGFKEYGELREAAVGVAVNQRSLQEKQKQADQLSKQMVAAHDFEVPDWLISSEAHQVALRTGRNLEDLTTEHQDLILTQAKNNVKWALILDKIREVEPETMYTNDEVLKMIVGRAQEAGQDPKAFLDHHQKNNNLVNMVASLKNEIVVEWLLKHSEIVD